VSAEVAERGRERPALPAPGPYPGIPREIYHAWDACHYSVLKLFERSAAHAREEILHPREKTAALTRGDAIHAAVLEPERFLAEYVGAPVLDRRRKADKLAWQAFEAEHAGKVVLSAEDHEAAVTIAAAIAGHETPRKLLRAPGHTELSVVATDPEFEIPVKCRPDRLTTFLDVPVVVDLKSTRDASPQGFGTEIARYSYHVQAAFYLRTLDLAAPHGQRSFVFVAFESEPPYACACYTLDQDSLQQGRRDVELYLSRYADAVRSGVWPGYPGGIGSVALPRWRMWAEPFEPEKDPFA